jgi:hypothetical protein
VITEEDIDGDIIDDFYVGAFEDADMKVKKGFLLFFAIVPQAIISELRKSTKIALAYYWQNFSTSLASYLTQILKYRDNILSGKTTMEKKRGKPKKEDWESLGGKKKEEFMQYKLEFDCYRDKLCMVPQEVEDEQRKMATLTSGRDDDDSELSDDDNSNGDSCGGDKNEAQPEYDWNLRSWDEAAVQYINSLNELLSRGKKRELPKMHSGKENSNKDNKRRFSMSACGKDDIRSKYHQSLGKTHNPPVVGDNKEEDV